MKSLWFIIFTFIPISIYGQITEDFIGKWHNKNTNGMIIIYPSGSALIPEGFGDWQVKDGKLEIVGDIYSYFYTLSDDFNQLIWEKYGFKGKISSTGYSLKYVRFGNDQSYSIGREERIQQRKLETERENQTQKAEEEELNRIKQAKVKEENRIREEEISKHIALGKDLFYNGNYEHAILEFEEVGWYESPRIEEFKKEFAESYFYFAKENFKKEKYYDALRLFYNANELSDNHNQYDYEIMQTHLKIAGKLELEADNLFNSGKFIEAISLYEEVYDYENVDYFILNKKIALSYEKEGDMYYKKKKYKSALNSYLQANQKYINLTVTKKILDTKNELIILKELKYNFDLSISMLTSFNNKSNSEFNEIYENPLGVNLQGNYRLNKYITIGLGYSFSEFKNKSGIKLLNALGNDTVGIIVKEKLNISEDRNLTISSIYFNLKVGYFIGLINPYIIGQITKNKTDISLIEYLEESSQGGYVEKGLRSSANHSGSSFGLGFRVGGQRWKGIVEVFKNYISGNTLLESYSSTKFQAGLTFIF